MERQLNPGTEQKVIEKLKSLPPQKVDEIIQFIDFISRKDRSVAGPNESHDFKAVLFSLRGRGRGEHLVSRLVQSRKKNQIADEKK